MAKENKTVADIIAEMRGDGHTGPADALEWVRIKLEHYADRLEAAHKREAAFHAMTCEANDRLREHLQIALDADKHERGDCAKLREALKNVAKQLTDATEDENFGEDVMYLVGCMRTMSQKCRAALAEPPRNCDKYPTFNDAIRALADKRGWHDAKWDSERYCILAQWLYAPATATEGGAK